MTDCDHMDAYGSTIIMGAREGDGAVCLVCDLAVRPDHVMSSACWCQPTTSYEDPVTSDRVFVHREIVA